MIGFTWAALSTHDPARVEPFYRDLFGWRIEGGYFLYNGAPVAGVDQMPEALRRRGMPPFWLSVVGVEDIAATCAVARRNGARVELEEEGYALVRDPLGAGFILSTRDTAAPSRFGHARFTADGLSLAPFYRNVFGWSIEAAAPGLLRLIADGSTVAHCHTLPDGQRGREEYWAVLFPVASLPEGRSPFELPEGRACALNDPDGAMVIAVETRDDPRPARPRLEAGARLRDG
ncbi:MAG: VOC family protein [Shimia sp.]